MSHITSLIMIADNASEVRVDKTELNDKFVQYQNKLLRRFPFFSCLLFLTRLDFFVKLN